MKYLKITILEPGNGPMVYPVGYQAEIGDFAVDHLYFDEIKSDGESGLLLCIPDKHFKPEMVRDGVVEITEAEAKTLSEANETRTEVITDEAKVRRLEIKSRLGLELTKDELDALDPTKVGSVFATSKILADRVTDLKSDELLAKAKEKPIA